MDATRQFVLREFFSTFDAKKNFVKFPNVMQKLFSPSAETPGCEFLKLMNAYNRTNSFNEKHFNRKFLTFF